MKGFMSIMSQFLVHKGAKIRDFHRTSHQTHPTSSTILRLIPRKFLYKIRANTQSMYLHSI